MIDQLKTNLPDSWNLVPLCEVAQLNPRQDKAAHTDNPLVTFVPMPNVEAGTGAIDVSETRSLAEVKAGYTSFLEGDVLFAKITPCMENGKMAIVPSLRYDLGFGSTEFHVLRPTRGISGQYLYFFVSSEDFRRQAKHNMTGAVGQRRVPVRYLADHPVPVPPVREQHRIVAKIHELFSELDKGVESLKTARAKLKVYRQAVLKHAFEGKLTEQWREENRDKLETAEELLARVKQEQQACYEQQLNEWNIAVEAWETTGKKGRKPTRPRAQTASPPLTDKDIADLPVLPNGWLWVKVQVLLTERPANGRSVKGRASGFPVLRLTAIKNNRLDLLESKNGDWEREDALGYIVRKGDFFLARGNGSKRLVGRGGLVPDLDRDIAYPDTMIRLRVNPRVVGEHFFSFVWNSRIVRRQIERTARTTAGIYKINQGHVINFVVPLCSSSEQTVIVNRLLSALSTIDRIEMEVEDHLTKAHTLRRSILNRAFSGELVEQDPNDEPAAALLERIKAEKASRKPKAKTRQRKVANA